MRASPIRTAEALVASAPDVPGTERFVGYGLMGQTFASGQVLGLRHWLRSSIGPAYTSVWYRDSRGRWSFWSTERAELSCTRYTSSIADDVRCTAIHVHWAGHDRLTVTVPEVDLRWTTSVSATPATRLLSAAAAGMRPLLTRPVVLGALGPAAGALLGTGPLSLRGTMPNGQQFQLAPRAVWRVASSSAVLDGTDLGSPAPLPRPTRIGDFRVPQRGLLAVGTIDFRAPANCGTADAGYGVLPMPNPRP